MAEPRNCETSKVCKKMCKDIITQKAKRKPATKKQKRHNFCTGIKLCFFLLFCVFGKMASIVKRKSKYGTSKRAKIWFENPHQFFFHLKKYFRFFLTAFHAIILFAVNEECKRFFKAVIRTDCILYSDFCYLYTILKIKFGKNSETASRTKKKFNKWRKEKLHFSWQLPLVSAVVASPHFFSLSTSQIDFPIPRKSIKY